MAHRQDYSGTFPGNSYNDLCNSFDKVQLRNASKDCLLTDYCDIRSRLLLLQNDEMDLSVPSKLGDIVQLLRRFIQEAPRHVRKNKEHLEDVYKMLIFLHNYISRHIKVYKKFPLTQELLSVLISYVELEYEVLYCPKNYSSQYQDQVESRILTFLLTILHDPSTVKRECFVKPSPVDYCAIKALYVVKSVKSEYKRNRSLIENLMSKLLQKLNVWDKMNEIREQTDAFNLGNLMRVPKLQQISRYLQKCNVLKDDAATSEEEEVVEITSPLRGAYEDIVAIDLVDKARLSRKSLIPEQINVQSRRNSNSRLNLHSTTSRRERVICVSDDDSDVEFVPDVASGTVINVDDYDPLVPNERIKSDCAIEACESTFAEREEAVKCLEPPIDTTNSQANVTNLLDKEENAQGVSQILTRCEPSAVDDGTITTTEDVTTHATTEANQHTMFDENLEHNENEEQSSIPKENTRDNDLQIVNNSALNTVYKEHDDPQINLPEESSQTEIMICDSPENEHKVPESEPLLPDLCDIDLISTDSSLSTVSATVSDPIPTCDYRIEYTLKNNEITNNIIAELDRAIDEHSSSTASEVSSDIVADQQPSSVPFEVDKEHDLILPNVNEVEDLRMDVSPDTEEASNLENQCPSRAEESASVEMPHVIIESQEDSLDQDCSHTASPDGVKDTEESNYCSNVEEHVSEITDESIEEEEKVEGSCSTDTNEEDRTTNGIQENENGGDLQIVDNTALGPVIKEHVSDDLPKESSQTENVLEANDSDSLPESQEESSENCDAKKDNIEHNEKEPKENDTADCNTLEDIGDNLVSEPCDFTKFDDCKVLDNEECATTVIDDYEPRPKDAEDTVLQLVEGKVEPEDLSSNDIVDRSFAVHHECSDSESVDVTVREENLSIDSSLLISHEPHLTIVDNCNSSHIEAPAACDQPDIELENNSSQRPNDPQLMVDDESVNVTKEPHLDNCKSSQSSGVSDLVEENVEDDNSNQRSNESQLMVDDVTEDNYKSSQSSDVPDAVEQNVSHVDNCDSSVSVHESDVAELKNDDVQDDNQCSVRDLSKSSELDLHQQSVLVTDDKRDDLLVPEVPHSSKEDDQNLHIDEPHLALAHESEKLCMESETTDSQHLEVESAHNDQHLVMEDENDEGNLVIADDPVESIVESKSDDYHNHLNASLDDITLSHVVVETSTDSEREEKGNCDEDSKENISEKVSDEEIRTEDFHTKDLLEHANEAKVNEGEVATCFERDLKKTPEEALVHHELVVEYTSELPLDYVHEETVITETCEVVVNDLDVLASVAATKEKIESVNVKIVKSKRGRKRKSGKKKSEELPRRVTRNSALAKLNINPQDNSKCIPSTFMNLESLVTPPPVCVYNMIPTPNTDTEESMDERFSCVQSLQNILVDNIAFDEDTLDDGIVFVTHKKVSEEILISIPESEDHPAIDYDILKQAEEFEKTNLSLSTSEELCKELKLTMTKNVEININITTELDSHLNETVIEISEESQKQVSVMPFKKRKNYGRKNLVVPDEVQVSITEVADVPEMSLTVADENQATPSLVENSETLENKPESKRVLTKAALKCFQVPCIPYVHLLKLPLSDAPKVETDKENKRSKSQDGGRRHRAGRLSKTKSIDSLQIKSDCATEKVETVEPVATEPNKITKRRMSSRLVSEVVEQSTKSPAKRPRTRSNYEKTQMESSKTKMRTRSASVFDDSSSVKKVSNSEQNKADLDKSSLKDVAIVKEPETLDLASSSDQSEDNVKGNLTVETCISKQEDERHQNEEVRKESGHLIEENGKSAELIKKETIGAQAVEVVEELLPLTSDAEIVEQSKVQPEVGTLTEVTELSKDESLEKLPKHRKSRTEREIEGTSIKTVKSKTDEKKRRRVKGESDLPKTSTKEELKSNKDRKCKSKDKKAHEIVTVKESKSKNEDQEIPPTEEVKSLRSKSRSKAKTADNQDRTHKKSGQSSKRHRSKSDNERKQKTPDLDTKTSLVGERLKAKDPSDKSARKDDTQKTKEKPAELEGERKKRKERKTHSTRKSLRDKPKLRHNKENEPKQDVDQIPHDQESDKAAPVQQVTDNQGAMSTVEEVPPVVEQSSAGQKTVNIQVAISSSLCTCLQPVEQILADDVQDTNLAETQKNEAMEETPIEKSIPKKELQASIEKVAPKEELQISCLKNKIKEKLKNASVEKVPLEKSKYSRSKSGVKQDSRRKRRSYSSGKKGSSAKLPEVTVVKEEVSLPDVVELPKRAGSPKSDTETPAKEASIDDTKHDDSAKIIVTSGSNLQPLLCGVTPLDSQESIPQVRDETIVEEVDPEESIPEIRNDSILEEVRSEESIPQIPEEAIVPETRPLVLEESIAEIREETIVPEARPLGSEESISQIPEEAIVPETRPLVLEESIAEIREETIVPETRPLGSEESIPQIPEEEIVPETRPLVLEESIPEIREETIVPEARPLGSEESIPQIPEEAVVPETRPLGLEESIPEIREETIVTETRPLSSEESTPQIPEEVIVPETRPLGAEESIPQIPDETIVLETRPLTLQESTPEIRDETIVQEMKPMGSEESIPEIRDETIVHEQKRAEDHSEVEQLPSADYSIDNEQKDNKLSAKVDEQDLEIKEDESLLPSKVISPTVATENCASVEDAVSKAEEIINTDQMKVNKEARSDKNNDLERVDDVKTIEEEEEVQKSKEDFNDQREKSPPPDNNDRDLQLEKEPPVSADEVATEECGLQKFADDSEIDLVEKEVSEEVSNIIRDWDNCEDSSDDHLLEGVRPDQLITEIVDDTDLVIGHEESIIDHSNTSHEETCVTEGTEFEEIVDPEGTEPSLAADADKLSSFTEEGEKTNETDDDDLVFVQMETLPAVTDNYDSEPDVDRVFEKYSTKQPKYSQEDVRPGRKKVSPKHKRVRFSLECNTTRTIDENGESPSKKRKLEDKRFVTHDYEQSYKKFLTESKQATPNSNEQCADQQRDSIANMVIEKKKTSEVTPVKKSEPKSIDRIIQNLKNKIPLPEPPTGEPEKVETLETVEESAAPSVDNLEDAQAIADTSISQTGDEKLSLEPQCQENIFPYIQDGTKFQIIPRESEIGTPVQLLEVTDKQTTTTCEITDNLIAVMFSEQNRSSKTGFIFFKGSDHNYHSIGDPLLGGECDTNESDHSSENKEIVSSELENVLISDTMLPYLTDNHLNQESSEDSSADFQLLELIGNTLGRESSPPLAQPCDYQTNLKQVELGYDEPSASNNIEFSKVNNEVFVNHFQQQTMSVENMSELMNVVLTSIQNLNNMTKAPTLQQEAECKDIFSTNDLDFNVESQPQSLDLICDFSQSQEVATETTISNHCDYSSLHYLPITFETNDSFMNKKVILERVPQGNVKPIEETAECAEIVEGSEVQREPTEIPESSQREMLAKLTKSRKGSTECNIEGTLTKKVKSKADEKKSRQVRDEVDGERVTQPPALQKETECKDIFSTTGLDFTVESQPQGLDLICDFSQPQDVATETTISNLGDYSGLHYLPITFENISTNDSFMNKKVIVEQIPQLVHETVKEMPHLEPMVEKPLYVKLSPSAKAKLHMINCPKQKPQPKKQLNNLGFVRNSSKTKPSAPKPKKSSELKSTESESPKVSSSPQTPTVKPTTSSISSAISKERSLLIIDDFNLAESSKKRIPKVSESPALIQPAPVAVKTVADKVELPKTVPKSPRTPKQTESELKPQPKKHSNNLDLVSNSNKTKPSAPKPKKSTELKSKESESPKVSSSAPTVKSVIPKERIIDDFNLGGSSKKRTPKPSEIPAPDESAVKTAAKSDSPKTGGENIKQSPVPKSPRTPKQTECELFNIPVQCDMIDNVKRRKRKPVDYSSIEKLLEAEDYEYRKVQKSKSKKDEKMKVKQEESKSKTKIKTPVHESSTLQQPASKSKSTVFEDSDDDIPKKKKAKADPPLQPDAMNALFDELVKEGNVNSTLTKSGATARVAPTKPSTIFPLDPNLQKKSETTPVKQIGVVNPIPRQSNNVRKEPPSRSSYSGEDARTSSQYYPYYERSRRSYPYSNREPSRSSHQGGSRRAEYPTHSSDQRYLATRSGSSRSSWSSRHHSNSRPNTEQRDYWQNRFFSQNSESALSCYICDLVNYVYARRDQIRNFSENSNGRVEPVPYGSNTDLAWREDIKKKFPHMFTDTKEVFF
ncbi:titin homolog isoform X2 [Photinus pyralis]|uniref:titin homolog isoform X2 n=1 Tax=Photinus pyralis TaxID=7054 RepID=UPI001266F00D|nr:titin homolog isoform X2 [Photinus pyralis]